MRDRVVSDRDVAWFGQSRRLGTGRLERVIPQRFIGGPVIEGPSSQGDRAQIVLVVGAGGTDDYHQEFDAWAAQWQEVARLSETDLIAIGRQDTAETNDRERLEKTIAGVPSLGSTPLWIVMIGHGTFSRGVAKFNLRGPDVSASELAQWLTHFERPVVIVNCASASGPFVNRLSGKNRIVVTATKSGSEQNFARFGGYFARAIASPDSDLDHDDEVSVQEAFLRSAEVRQFYEKEARIATEHALLDDNGDSKGTPPTMFRGTRPSGKTKDGTPLDGASASRVTLAPAGTRLPFTDEELEQRASLEKQLDALRARKDELDEQAYDAQLEPLMLRLAKLYRAAEQRLEKPGDKNSSDE